MITQEWGNAMQVHSLEAKLGLVKGIWRNHYSLDELQQSNSDQKERDPRRISKFY